MISILSPGTLVKVHVHVSEISKTYLTHISRIEFSILIIWKCPFPLYGLLGGIFHFYSNCNSLRIFCLRKQWRQIRFHILRHLIWDCTVCLCPTKRMLGLYGLWKRILSQFKHKIYAYLDLWQNYLHTLHNCISRMLKSRYTSKEDH